MAERFIASDRSAISFQSKMSEKETYSRTMEPLTIFVYALLE
jgi:hypothetical protein